jgi:hypothetical protein
MVIVWGRTMEITYEHVRRIKDGSDDPTHVSVVKDQREVEYIKKIANPALKDTGNKLVENETEALLALGKSGDAEAIQVKKSDEDRGLRFIVLDKAPGRSLDNVVHDLRKTGATENKVPNEEYIARAITLYKGILGELKKTHGQGVIHHDIIPSNIVADSSFNVKLVDFAHAGRVKEGVGIEHFVTFGQEDQAGLERGERRYQQDASYSPFNVDWSHDEMTEDSFRKNETTGAIQKNHDVYMATNILHWMLTGKRLGERTATDTKKKFTSLLFQNKGGVRKRYAPLNDIFAAAENIRATEYVGDAILALLEEKEEDLLGAYRIKKKDEGAVGLTERGHFESALATAEGAVRVERRRAHILEQTFVSVQRKTTESLIESERQVRSAEDRARTFEQQHDGLSSEVDALLGLVNTGTGSTVLPRFSDPRINQVGAAVTAAESTKATAVGRFNAAAKEITAWRTLSHPQKLYARLKSEGKDKLMKYGGMALAGVATLALVVGLGGFIYGRTSAPVEVIEKPVVHEVYVTSPEVEVMLAPITEYCQTNHNTQDFGVCATTIQAGDELRGEYEQQLGTLTEKLSEAEQLAARLGGQSEQYAARVRVLEAEIRGLESGSGDVSATLDRYVRETRPQAASAIVALYNANQVQLACDMAVHFKGFYGGRGIRGELKTVMSDLNDSAVCRGKL